MDEITYKVLEIFYSIDGEGRRAGELTTFIRMAGCNCACSWCFGPNKYGNYPFVTLPDLSKKPLDEVEVGDTILTLDPATQQIKETTVTNVSNRDVDVFHSLRFNNTSLIVTPEHPFYIDNQWKEVKDISAGDVCMNATNEHYAQYLIDTNIDALREYSKVSIERLTNEYECYRKQNSGSHNGNYNPNKYNYLLLKEAIRKGIARTDIIEGETCTSLVVHHLDHNPDNDALDNLVIISNALHNKLHTRGKSFWNKKTDVYPLKGLPVIMNNSNKENKQLGTTKQKTVIGISCSPYNTYLINDILVHNCDTAYSQGCNGGNPMTISEILGEISKYDCHNITLTGGEPLLQSEIGQLIDVLYEQGYDVNIETNGTIDPSPYLKDSNPLHHNRVWATVDYKSKSSGMQSKMNLSAYNNLRHCDVVKFVVGSEEELKDADAIIKKYIAKRPIPNRPSVYFSPVFGMIEPKEIVEFMKKRKYGPYVKVQVQLHKIIWDPKERMV